MNGALILNTNAVSHLFSVVNFVCLGTEQEENFGNLPLFLV
jgi:hypothetical protein